MKTIKLISFFFLVCIAFKAKAVDNKTVTLITSGQGKTQDEAKQNALRNAIEQAFGAFISSHTEVVNENLVKDEIISISNGNIQNYEIISESALPDNLGYTTTLKTIVSISKLTSFCESKGMQIEVKGSLFAFNVIQKELSASNEKKVLQELVLMAKNIAPKMFDYSLSSQEPLSNNYGSCRLPMKVIMRVNNNYTVFYDHLLKTLNGIALKQNDLDDFKKLNVNTYPTVFFVPKKKLIGKVNYYRFCLQSGGDEKEFDMQELGSLVRKKGVCDVAVTSHEYRLENYAEAVLYFRTDEIENVVINIQRIFETEITNYCIYADQQCIINGAQAKKTFFYTPIEFLKSSMSFEEKDSQVQDLIRFSSISSLIDQYDRILINNHRHEFSPKHGWSAVGIALNNFHPNAIVGFAYLIPSFSLERIKLLDKLEIKRK